MAELALATFFATALLMEDAQHSLRVHTEGHPLYLHGLEQLGSLLLGLLSGLLVGLEPGLFSGFLLLIEGFVG